MNALIEELSPYPREFANLVNKFNKFGLTPLMEVVRDGQYSTVELLIDKAGAILNIRNKLGNTVAHIAALNGHLRIIQLLIDRGVDILAKNFEENTCLDHAELCGVNDVFAYLEPLSLKAEIWHNRNCLVKIFLNKERVPAFSKLPKDVFREIIKYT
jgi:ankyrin repeat protein